MPKNVLKFTRRNLAGWPGCLVVLFKGLRGAGWGGGGGIWNEQKLILTAKIMGFVVQH